MNDCDAAPLADDERGLRTTVPRVIQSGGRARAFAADGDWGKLRASDTDRDRVVELLNVAYSEGRLSKEEYDGRLENAFSARTYAELDQIVIDLPVARAAMAAPGARVAPVAPVAQVNGLAIASLACGVAQFAFGPLATIPAIVLGHTALHQIKRSGEQGAGLALAGLILGWAAVILVILILVAGVAMSVRTQGTMR